jgi:hypothetical protein
MMTFEVTPKFECSELGLATQKTYEIVVAPKGTLKDMDLGGAQGEHPRMRLAHCQFQRAQAGHESQRVANKNIF